MKKIFILLMLLVCIVAPLIVEYRFPIPSGKGDWLGFWGSYLGIIPSGLIAYFVAKYQIDREHKNVKEEQDREYLPYFSIENNELTFNSINSLPIQKVTIEYYDEEDKKLYVLQSSDRKVLGLSRCCDECDKGCEHSFLYLDGKFIYGFEFDSSTKYNGRLSKNGFQERLKDFLKYEKDELNVFKRAELQTKYIGSVCDTLYTDEEGDERGREYFTNFKPKKGQLPNMDFFRIYEGSFYADIRFEYIYPSKIKKIVVTNDVYKRIDITCNLINGAKIFFTNGLGVQDAHFVKLINGDDWEQYVYETDGSNKIAKKRLEESDIYNK